VFREFSSSFISTRLFTRNGSGTRLPLSPVIHRAVSYANPPLELFLGEVETLSEFLDERGIFFILHGSTSNLPTGDARAHLGRYDSLHGIRCQSFVGRAFGVLLKKGPVSPSTGPGEVG